MSEDFYDKLKWSADAAIAAIRMSDYTYRLHGFPSRQTRLRVETASGMLLVRVLVRWLS